MEKDSRIYVAGSTGLVGSAIVRDLKSKGHTKIITSSRAELNLCNARATEKFFAEKKPEYIFNAAARVGGILANKNHKANMLVDNLRIQTNLIESAPPASGEKIPLPRFLMHLPQTCQTTNC